MGGGWLEVDGQGQLGAIMSSAAGKAKKGLGRVHTLRWQHHVILVEDVSVPSG